MHQAIQNRVGECGIPQGIVPVLHWKLTRDDRGPAIVAIFHDLDSIATIFITERRQTPVIQNQDIRLG